MRKIIILGIAIIIILGGLILLPKLLGSDSTEVKFKTIEEEDLPSKIADALPNYIMEERALTFEYEEDIYVIVTRGEKTSEGYTVDIDNIKAEPFGDAFDLVVYAKFTDPNPNEIQTQEYDYPMIIVKTNLDELPNAIHLDVEYVNE